MVDSIESLAEILYDAKRSVVVSKFWKEQTWAKCRERLKEEYRGQARYLLERYDLIAKPHEENL